MDTVLRDLRFGLRVLVRKPVFAIIAIATLALGIGANVAVFTLVNAVLFHPLPVSEPERLVNVYTTDTSVEISGFTLLPTSFRNYEDLRDHNEVFEDLAYAAPLSVVLSDDDNPRTVSGYVTSASYFDVLGVAPVLGRAFTPEEDALGGGIPVVVLSHSLWSRQFGADAGIVGSTLRLNNETFSIIGVVPAGFRGTSTLVDADQIWVPTSAYDRVLSGVRRERFLDRRGLFVNVFGRLEKDTTIDEARAHIKALGASLAEQYPRDNANRSVTIGLMSDAAYGPTPYRGADESRQARTAASVLIVVSGLVLLIACVNLANLLLAKGADREKEMSIRAELGASPRHLAQQLLVESLVLASAGGVFGLGVAAWGRDLLWRLRPPSIASDIVDVSIDGHVLAFAFGVTLITGVLFGFAPALLGASSKDLHSHLKLGGRSGASREGRGRLRHGLVATEVALAFVALVAAGLFLRSLQQGRSIDPGFEPDGLVTFSFDVGAAGYDRERGLTFYEELLARIRHHPGVHSAALSQHPPVAISPYRALVPEGEADDSTRFGPAVTVNVVSDGYFEALGIRLVDGRGVDSSDRTSTRPVSVVTQTLADRFWPGEDALGRRFRFSGTDAYYEIVGVVEDAVVRNVLDDPAPVAYFPLHQSYLPAVVMNLRAEASPESIVGEARALMHALDPNLAITGESIVSHVLAQGLWAPRVGAALLGLFGLLALVLATIGVYGVLAYTVSRRTQEVGVRLVFGASRFQIYRLLIGQGMIPALAGLGGGIFAALAFTRYSAGLLFQVSPHDGPTFLATLVLLAGVAFLACTISVRRAARLDPMSALRSE